MTAHIPRMAMTGLLVAAVAPGLLLVLLRIAPRLDRCTVPAAVAFPGFVVLHFAVTAWSAAGRPPPGLDTALLLFGAVLFWAPVLGVRHRLSDPLRTLYLYTGMPLLDLAGVWLVATGDGPGGLSMIAGMLPMGLAAVSITWHWIHHEERRVAAGDPDATRRVTNPETSGGGVNMGVSTRNQRSPRRHRSRT